MNLKNIAILFVSSLVVSEGKECCEAETAKCLACKKGVSLKKYCKKLPETEGCPDRPKVCCKAMTAKCLACEQGVTPADYCEKNPDTKGCKMLCEKALIKACIDEESLPADSKKDKKNKQKLCKAEAKELCKK